MAMDHVTCLAENLGMDREAHGLLVYDYGTAWVELYPVIDQGSEQFIHWLADFVGPDATLRHLYSDGAPEFDIAAIHYMATHDMSTPGRKGTSGVADRRIG